MVGPSVWNIFPLWVNPLYGTGSHCDWYQNNSPPLFHRTSLVGSLTHQVGSLLTSMIDGINPTSIYAKNIFHLSNFHLGKECLSSIQLPFRQRISFINPISCHLSLVVQNQVVYLSIRCTILLRYVAQMLLTNDEVQWQSDVTSIHHYPKHMLGLKTSVLPEYTPPWCLSGTWHATM